MPLLLKAYLWGIPLAVFITVRVFRWMNREGDLHLFLDHMGIPSPAINVLGIAILWPVFLGAVIVGGGAALLDDLIVPQVQAETARIDEED